MGVVFIRIYNFKICCFFSHLFFPHQSVFVILKGVITYFLYPKQTSFDVIRQCFSKIFLECILEGIARWWIYDIIEGRRICNCYKMVKCRLQVEQNAYRGVNFELCNESKNNYSVFSINSSFSLIGLFICCGKGKLNRSTGPKTTNNKTKVQHF